jgi:hypothetical protein
MLGMAGVLLWLLPLPIGGNEATMDVALSLDSRWAWHADALRTAMEPVRAEMAAALDSAR